MSESESESEGPFFLWILASSINVTDCSNISCWRSELAVDFVST